MEKNKKPVGAVALTDAEMAQINAFAKSELTADEVYAFAVKLCDNEIDRDGERFTRATLEQLAELFVGKSGLFDHDWSAQGQTARIYRAEVVDGEGTTAAGDGYCYVKAWAYMLRSEKNAELIAEIEGGIKKEVSVGCSVKRSVCSVCGEEIATCGHEKGQTYGGRLCYAELTDAIDAYEWSFVAVPAQRGAGVMKRCAQEEGGTLRTLVKRRGSRAQARELEGLEKLAALGRRYTDELRREVARLMMTAEQTLPGETAEKIAQQLGTEELCALRALYAEKNAALLGLSPQLGPGGEERRADDESDFRI